MLSISYYRSDVLRVWVKHPSFQAPGGAVGRGKNRHTTENQALPRPMSKEGLDSGRLIVQDRT